MTLSTSEAKASVSEISTAGMTAKAGSFKGSVRDEISTILGYRLAYPSPLINSTWPLVVVEALYRMRGETRTRLITPVPMTKMEQLMKEGSEELASENLTLAEGNLAAGVEVLPPE